MGDVLEHAVESLQSRQLNLNPTEKPRWGLHEHPSFRGRGSSPCVPCTVNNRGPFRSIFLASSLQCIWSLEPFPELGCEPNSVNFLSLSSGWFSPSTQALVLGTFTPSASSAWWRCIQNRSRIYSLRPQVSSPQPLTAPGAPGSGQLWRGHWSGRKCSLNVPGPPEPVDWWALICSHCHQEEGSPAPVHGEGLCCQDFCRGHCQWISGHRKTHI